MKNKILVKYVGPAVAANTEIRMRIREALYVFGPKPRNGLPPYHCYVLEADFAARIAAAPEKWLVVEDPTPETNPVEATDPRFDRYQTLHAQREENGGRLSKKLEAEYQTLLSDFGPLDETADEPQDGLSDE